MGKTEYELRVLEVDSDDLITQLDKLGATKVAEYSFRRHVFETIPPVKGRWVRLRSDGKQTTLTVKQITADTVDGTIEWETTVDSFDTTFEILQKIGLKSKGYQENKRIEYQLDGCQVCIDTWPQIPTYLEIEANSESAVRSCAQKLGFSESDLTGMNNEKIYLHYGIDISTEADLRF